MLKLDQQQYRQLCAAANAEQRTTFIEMVQQQWQQAHSGLLPGVAALEEWQVRTCVETCYDDCFNHEIHHKGTVLNYSFQVLRALNLGAGTGFLQGMRDYFVSQRSAPRPGLEWIAFVVGSAHDHLHLLSVEPAIDQEREHDH